MCHFLKRDTWVQEEGWAVGKRGGCWLASASRPRKKEGRRMGPSNEKEENQRNDCKQASKVIWSLLTPLIHYPVHHISKQGKKSEIKR
jgi:hypothetical protein